MKNSKERKSVKERQREKWIYGEIEGRRRKKLTREDMDGI